MQQRALGKVTGALVQRVDRSDLHPGERLLDSSESHQFAHDGHAVRFRCDECGALSASRLTEAAAIHDAESQGWTIESDADNGKDYCPVHKPGTKLLPGKTAVPSAAMSTEHAILMLRLEWLASKFSGRVDPRVFLDNCRSTGHRTMLSDLLRGKDHLDFFERVFEVEDGFARKHPDRVPPPFREAGMPGQEWLAEVLILVHAEDTAGV